MSYRHICHAGQLYRKILILTNNVFKINENIGGVCCFKTQNKRCKQLVDVQNVATLFILS